MFEGIAKRRPRHRGRGDIVAGMTVNVEAGVTVNVEAGMTM